MAKPKTIHVPMTRMNLVGLLDNAVIAPARFLQRRKYYEDFTRHCPDQILGFDSPCFPVSSRWHDLPEDLNFGVLLEIQLPPDTATSIAIVENGSLRLVSKAPRRRKGVTPAVLVAEELPACVIEKVHTPGPKTAEALRQDPYIQGRWPPELFAPLGVVPVMVGLVEDMPGLRADDTAGPQNDRGFERRLKMAGATCLMAEVCSRQDWRFGHGWATHILSTAATLSSDPAGGELPVPDFTSLDGYCDVKPAALREPAGLGRLANMAWPSVEIRSLVDAWGLRQGEEDSGAEDAALELADTIALVLLLEEVQSARPDQSSPKALVQRWRARLEEYASELPQAVESVLVNRLVVAVDRIEDTLSGRVPSEQLFHRSVEWATAVRAALMFALRSDPQSVIDWPAEERPGKRASVGDLLRAAFLCGAYSGYTRLPVSVKDRWRGLMTRIVFGDAGQEKEEFTTKSHWHMDAQGMISGALSLWSGNDCLVETISRSSAGDLVREFGERTAQKRIGGGLAALEHRAIAMLSGQVEGASHRKLELTVTPEMHAAEAGRRVVQTINAVAPKFIIDDEALVEDLAESPPSTVTPEILAVLCHCLGYPAPELAVHEKRDTYYWLERDLDLMEMRVRNMARMPLRDEALEKINLHGIALTRDVVDLVSQSRVAEPVCRKLLEALLYLSLRHDLIKESSEPGAALMDDWIVLTETVSEVCSSAGRARDRSTKDSGLNALMRKAKKLRQEIVEEFGQSFVAAVLSGRREPRAAEAGESAVQ